MSKIWITRDGRRIPYAQLEHGHLVNIINMLWRAAKAKALLNTAGEAMAYASEAPEGAAMAASNEAADMLEALDDREKFLAYEIDPSDYLNEKYFDLVAELDRRGKREGNDEILF